MAFSYSGLKNYGKSTLPSVDSWGTNNNILKDPPKSITTRRINKVSETTLLNEMIDDAQDRNAEVIKRFARGVNPMVNVSYSNNHNMSGKIQVSGNTQPRYKLPAFDNGAFRAPIRSEKDLLPLSRQARKTTHMNVNIQDIDYSKRLRECGTDQNTLEVKKNIIRTNIRPTAFYKLEKSATRPSNVKHSVYSRINVSANAGYRPRDITNRIVQKPYANILDNNMKSFATTNPSNLNVYYNNNKFNPERYIQDRNEQSVTTNLSSNLNITNINDVISLSELEKNIKEIPNINYNTNKNGNYKIDYIHKNIDLQTNLPTYNVITNKNENIQKNIKHENEIILENNKPNTSCNSVYSGTKQVNNNATEIILKDKLNLGGYEIIGTKPIEINTHYNPTLKQQRYNTNKIVNQEFKSKFNL